MVSTNQSNTSGEEYGSEYEKLVRKPDQVLRGTIEGLQSIEDCRKLIEAEAEHEGRSGVIGCINERMQELQDRGGDTDE